MAAIEVPSTIRRLLETAPSLISKDRPFSEQWTYSSDIMIAADAAEEHSSFQGLKNLALKLQGVVNEKGQVQAQSVAELSLFLAQRGNLQAAFSVVETVLNEASFGISGSSLLGRLLIRQINLRVEDWDNPVLKFTFNRLPVPFEHIYRAVNAAAGCKQDGVWRGDRLMNGFEDDVVPMEAVPKTGFIHFNLGNQTRREQKKSLAERGQDFIHPADLASVVAVQLAEHGEGKTFNSYNGNRYILRTRKVKTKNKGGPVSVLKSSARGVGGGCWDADRRLPEVVPAGSPKH